MQKYQKVFVLIIFLAVVGLFAQNQSLHAQDSTPSATPTTAASSTSDAFNIVSEFFKILCRQTPLGALCSGNPSGSNGQNQQDASNRPTVKGLNYYIPFRDSSITPIDGKEIISSSWPGGKIEYYDRIVERSVASGWNPAFVLTLWVEETGASTATFARNGGTEQSQSGNYSKGHLGCAPSEDQTIDESLDCLFNNFSRFSNDEFATFMSTYSGGGAGAPFSNNPNFPQNIKYWYDKLVPSGTQQVNTRDATQKGESNTAIASLVAQIQANCSTSSVDSAGNRYSNVDGVVSVENANCLDSLDLGGSSDSFLAYLRNSVRAGDNYYLQCVGFARSAAELASFDGGNVCTSGNAISCPSTSRGYEFVSVKNRGDKQIVPGNLIVWDYSPYGHVAYVTSVQDQNNITIAEANRSRRGLVREINMSLDEPNVMGWLTK